MIMFLFIRTIFIVVYQILVSSDSNKLFALFWSVIIYNPSGYVFDSKNCFCDLQLYIRMQLRSFRSSVCSVISRC